MSTAARTATATAAIAWCLALLVGADVLLRTLDSWSTSSGSANANGSPPVFILGSSRTRAALSPAIIESTLATAGIADTWVANVSRKGATMAGLYQHYLKQIHPWVEHAPLGGIVAVEVGPQGLNDYHQTPREKEFLAEIGMSSPAMDYEWPWERVPRVAFSQVRVFGELDDLRRTLRRARLRLLGDEGESGWRAVPKWSQSDKGWKPRPDKPPEDLDERRWRERYTGALLSNYQVGGLQIEVLARFVKTIREDGFRPILYVMPVTNTQRSFYQPGDWERAQAALVDLGRREGVALVNLGESHHVAPGDWFDTHHVGPGGVDDISIRFAREVVLPGLGD